MLVFPVHATIRCLNLSPPKVIPPNFFKKICFVDFQPQISTSRPLRSAIGLFSHVDFESEVQNTQIFQPESKKMEKQNLEEKKET